MLNAPQSTYQQNKQEAKAVLPKMPGYPLGGGDGIVLLKVRHGLRVPILIGSFGRSLPPSPSQETRRPGGVIDDVSRY